MDQLKKELAKTGRKSTAGRVVEAAFEASQNRSNPDVAGRSFLAALDADMLLHVYDTFAPLRAAVLGFMREATKKTPQAASASGHAAVHHQSQGPARGSSSVAGSGHRRLQPQSISIASGG